jgi:hypothetical protein
MKTTIANHLAFVLCVLIAIASAFVMGRQHFSEPQDDLEGVLFGALAVLATVGVLGFITQFFAQRTSRVLSSVFFGYFAGIVATNIIINIVSGAKYTSLAYALMGYGLMFLFLGLAIC